MNKMTTAFSILSVSLALTSCNTFNALGNAGGNVVGTGVGMVSTGTSAAVNTVGTGLGMLVSPITGTRYHKSQVIYRHGHTYQLHNGRYVKVN